MYRIISSRLKTLVTLTVLLGLIGTPLINAQQDPDRPAVSVKNIELYDTVRQRPVMLTVWYPSGTACSEAEICLSDKTRTDQAAIISHGAMGAAKNYNWLGYAFASQDMVVVGVNHFGESWAYGKNNVDPSSVLKFGQRPLDVSFTLNQLSKNINTVQGDQANKKIFNLSINWNNTSGLGHSSGGATILALVGAQYDFSQAKNYCDTKTGSNDKSCHYLKTLTPESAPTAAEVGSNTSFTDARIKRAVVLDPALGHVSTRRSLQKIATPTLLIASKDNDFLPYSQHASYYSLYINEVKTKLLEQGEGHFVYLDQCNHKHQAMGVSLCTDRVGVDRKASQRQLYPTIFKFIYSH